MKESGDGMERITQEVKLEVVQKIEMKYRLYLPRDYKSNEAATWPLVVFLHGAGERGNDPQRLGVHGIPREADEGREFPFLVLAPQCPEPSVWIMQQDQVMELISRFCRDYRVDPQRIYLTGISMGGFGTWEIAMTYPEVFAAIVPICGGGMSWRADRLLSTPIWTFHGGKDDVVPLVYTEEMVRALRVLGNPVQFTVYPEAGHDCWTEVYQREDIYEWLLEQYLPTKLLM